MLKLGVMVEFITIVNVAVVAHWPAAGVKVYVVVEALLMGDDHEPVIPLSEVIGKVRMLAPMQ